MAALGTPGGVHSASLAHARTLGIKLPSSPGRLKRWRPTAADAATRLPDTAARAAVDPDGPNLLVRTCGENAPAADAMIARALQINGISDRAFKPAT